MNFGTEFEGLGVIVTGALGVFGRGLATEFAKVGAKVCITDMDQGEVEALAAELGTEDSFGHACDLTDASSIEGLVASVGEH